MRTFPVYNNDESAGLEQPEGTSYDGTPYSYIKDGDVRVTLRLVLWNVPRSNEGARSIRDVKEQIVTIWKDIWPSSKFTPFMEGWKLAVKYVLTHSQEAETLMPADFMNSRIYTVVGMKTPTTPEDYARALLARGRLGKWLPRGTKNPF